MHKSTPMKPLLCFAILSCIALAGFSQSQPPVPSAGKEVQKGQSESQKNNSKPDILQRGTEQAPIVVLVQKTASEENAAQNNERQALDNATIQRGQLSVAQGQFAIALIALVAVAAQIIIAYLQLKLFQTQLEYMNKSLADADLAAVTAERAAVATEGSVRAMKISDEQQLRAYVSFQIFPPILRVGETIRFQFLCINHGRTPALKLGFRAFAEFYPSPLPAAKDLRRFGNDKMNIERATIFPSATTQNPNDIISCDLGDPPLTNEQIGKWKEGREELLFGLEIEYWDVFSAERRITRTYFRYDRGGQMSVVPETSFAN